VRFDHELIPATLIRRYQRFLADVRLPDGSTLTVHCPNSGSMRGCLVPGWPVRISDSGNPARKYRHTWELVHNGRCWIGVNTQLANRIALEGIADGTVEELTGRWSIRREVRCGRRSRIDILLEGGARRCFVEVKNVTMVAASGRYAFPDAVTDRGRRHLEELWGVVAGGDRAVMLFVLQRADGDCFTTADDIDPRYGEALRDAVAAGVEALAYRAEVDPSGIRLSERVPIEL
jgi:sugar fermentation stimulation protein A